MRFDIITCVPALLESPFAHSIMRRAIDKGLLEVYVHDLRQYAINKHKQVDDYPYGGGAGMVMMIEPIDRAIEALKAKNHYDAVIYMSPDGVLMQQKLVNSFSLMKNIIILCGHYKGVDERVREHIITHEISIGDYVISGGELGAAVFVDAVARLIPGVLSDETSALSDSFQDDLLAPPVYTRPAVYKNWPVPEILLSGHQAKIEAWRHEQAIERTKARRPELLKQN
jgi:tRNA (guanine37-N1)-methyltransferase